MSKKTDNKIIYHWDIEQQTEKWFELHDGRMTASHATAIGNAGKGLETYCKEIVRKSISINEKSWSNSDSERGNELEPIARQLYEMEKNVIVKQVGFVEYSEYVGCSPDGLVEEEGGLEIKSPDNKAYFEYLLNGEKAIESDYIWQIQMNLLITGRKWWDLVVYNPNFKNSMLIFRIYPDKEKFEALLNGFEVGKAKIVEIKNKLNN